MYSRRVLLPYGACGRAIPYPYASPNRAKGVSGIFTIRLRVVRIGGLPDLTFKSFEWSLRSNFVCIFGARGGGTLPRAHGKLQS